jgi:aryl sulfotransferase
MNRMANDSTGKDPSGLSVPQRASLQASLQAAYETLSDAREAAARNKYPHLSAADLDNIPEDGLLILCAAEAVKALALRGYLEFRDNPDDPRMPIIVFTEQGCIAADKAFNPNPWAGFPFRPGDIVISTAPKNGTTWMQMICALLIFQTSVLPASIPELSPWLESKLPEQRARIKELATQQHRRFIKTHIPLNEIPVDPHVTYIVVARNPLDAAVSLHYQESVLLSTNDPGQPKRPHGSVRQFVLDMIDQIGTAKSGQDSFFDKVLKYLTCAWERRAEPNVVLVHYEDLSADLEGEMRRLARRLDIKVPEDIWPSLVQSATFKQMRAAADQLQPLQYADTRDASKGHAAFFRRGSSGDGRALLTEAEAARYYTRASQVAPQELLAWLHRGDESYYR